MASLETLLILLSSPMITHLPWCALLHQRRVYRLPWDSRHGYKSLLLDLWFSPCPHFLRNPQIPLALFTSFPLLYYFFTSLSIGFLVTLVAVLRLIVSGSNNPTPVKLVDFGTCTHLVIYGLVLTRL